MPTTKKIHVELTYNTKNLKKTQSITSTTKKAVNEFWQQSGMDRHVTVDRVYESLEKFSRFNLDYIGPKKEKLQAIVTYV